MFTIEADEIAQIRCIGFIFDKHTQSKTSKILLLKASCKSIQILLRTLCSI